MNTFTDLFQSAADGMITERDGWRFYSGPAWLEDNAMGIPPGLTEFMALTDTELSSTEQLARAEVQMTAEAVGLRVGLMVRAEVAPGSPDIVHRCYLVTLESDGEVAVYSILSSDPAPAALATVTTDLDLTRAHNLIVKVTDEGTGATVRVFIDDEVTPVLAISDRRTMRPEGLRVGFALADADPNPRCTLGEFYTHVLRSAIIRNPLPCSRLMNFGDLKYELGFRLDRNGNSQFPDAIRGDYLNHVMNEVYLTEGFWRWCERGLTFSTASGVRAYELPAYVGIPGGLTDYTNGRMLDKQTWKEMRRANPDDSAGCGYPLKYTVAGTGNFGGPVIAIDPVPNGQYTIEMPYYAKPVPMVEDTDIPMLPPEYLEVLLYGALMRAAQYSDNATLYQTSSADFARLIREMRRHNHREADYLARMTNLNTLKRNASCKGAYRPYAY